MSVTYLMQYSVQYIIAPVIWVFSPPPLICLDGMKKNWGVWLVWAWKVKKKRQSRIYKKFLCDFKLV